MRDNQRGGLKPLNSSICWRVSRKGGDNMPEDLWVVGKGDNLLSIGQGSGLEAQRTNVVFEGVGVRAE